MLLNDCTKNKDKLWAMIRKVNRKKGQANNITLLQWYKYYRELLNQNTEIAISHSDMVSNYLDEHEVNCEMCLSADVSSNDNLLNSCL